MSNLESIYQLLFDENNDNRKEKEEGEDEIPIKFILDGMQ
jgi:hypothetical protein